MLLYAHVVVKTANVVISRCCFAYDGTELFNSACCTCGRLVFPCSANQILVLTSPLPLQSSMRKLSNRERKQQHRQRQRKRHLKINIWKMMTILRLLLLPHNFVVDRGRCKWTGRCAVEVNMEIERFSVVYSR